MASRGGGVAVFRCGTPGVDTSCGRRQRRLWLSTCVRPTANVGVSWGWSWPSISRGERQRFRCQPPWTLCGFSSCGYQELGAWGPCGWWLRWPLLLVPSACHRGQQVTGNQPDLLLANRRPPFVRGLDRARIEVPEWPGIPLIGSLYWHECGTGRSRSRLQVTESRQVLTQPVRRKLKGSARHPLDFQRRQSQ
jgi:hypothetical protein